MCFDALNQMLKEITDAKCAKGIRSSKLQTAKGYHTLVRLTNLIRINKPIRKERILKGTK